MKVVIQRAKNAAVYVDNKLINQINGGLVLLVGLTPGDGLKDIHYLVNKIINLRIFNDEKGIMNKSILDTNGSILSISQFTLFADTKKGNRPSYNNAMKSEEAYHLYHLFLAELSRYVPTKNGVFGADMEVSLTNDGPVTIIIDTKE